MPPRRFSHRDRIEPRRLDENVLRLLRDHRVEAAHDSGKSHGPIRVRDDQVVGRKLAVNSVQRFERFTLARPANDNLAAFKQIEIEGVRGMPHLPERVVGSVGGIVN